MNLRKKILRKLFIARNKSWLRLQNKKANWICEANKDHWVTLTPGEKKKTKADNRNFYVIYKNCYGLTEETIDYYVTPEMYENEMLPKLNPLNHQLRGLGSCFAAVFSEKNYFPILMNEFSHPEILVRRIKGTLMDGNFQKIDIDTALKILAPYDNVVFKSSRDSDHGKGVRSVSSNDFEKTLSSYSENFVVQKIIVQCPEFAYFGNSSVNVMRVLSLNWKGEVFILSSYFRVGAPGSFCDHLGNNGVDPLAIRVLPNGNFDTKAFDYDAARFTDTVFGKAIRGGIPGYDDIITKIKQAHQKYPDYGIIGWDITVDEHYNPIVIEYNVRYPAISTPQELDGPVFMKKTERGNTLLSEILSEPFDWHNQVCY